jgi:hypothetical protein
VLKLYTKFQFNIYDSSKDNDLWQTDRRTDRRTDWLRNGEETKSPLRLAGWGLKIEITFIYQMFMYWSCQLRSSLLHSMWGPLKKINFCISNFTKFVFFQLCIKIRDSNEKIFISWFLHKISRSASLTKDIHIQLDKINNFTRHIWCFKIIGRKMIYNVQLI